MTPVLTEALFDAVLFETGQLCAEQRPNGSFRVFSAPLTRAVLERHLSGEVTFGVQLAQDATGACKAGCLELRGRAERKTQELQPGQLEELWESVLKIHALAAKHQIFTWAEHAGGVGWRVWVFASAPVKAAVLRAALKRLASEAHLPAMTPIYPAYNAALLTGWVKLPPNLDRVTGFWSGFVPQRFDASHRLTEGPSWTSGTPDIPLDQLSLMVGFERTSAAALIAYAEGATVETSATSPKLQMAVLGPVPAPSEVRPQSVERSTEKDPSPPTVPHADALEADWRAEFHVLAYVFQRPESRQTLRRTVTPADFRGCTDVSVGDEGDEASVEHATLYAAALEADRQGLPMTEMPRTFHEIQRRQQATGEIQPLEIVERMIGALLAIEGLNAERFMRDVAHIRMRAARISQKSIDTERLEDLPAQATMRRAVEESSFAPLEIAEQERNGSEIAAFEPSLSEEVAPAASIERGDETPFGDNPSTEENASSRNSAFLESFVGDESGEAVEAFGGDLETRASVAEAACADFDAASLVSTFEMVPSQLAVADRSRRAGAFQPLDALAPAFLARLLDAPQSIPTMSGELNEALGGGFRRGELYVVAAPQQGGKTTFAASALDYCAAQATPALLISYGLTREQLYFAGLAREAKVSLADIDGRRWQDRSSPAWFELSQKLAQAARAYQAKGEYLAIVEASPSDSIGELRGLVGQMRAHYELAPGLPALVAIDGIQDMTLGETDLGYVMPESWRVRRLMSRLKQMARDMDVAIVVTAEIDETAYLRALTAGRFKRYALSGALGLFTAADVVLLLQTGYIRAGFDSADIQSDSNREMLMDQLQLLQEEYAGRGDARRVAARIRKEFPLEANDAQACYARVSVMKNRSGKLATCLFMHQRAWQRFDPLCVKLPDQELEDIPTGTV